MESRYSKRIENMDKAMRMLEAIKIKTFIIHHHQSTILISIRIQLAKQLLLVMELLYQQREWVLYQIRLKTRTNLTDNLLLIIIETLLFRIMETQLLLALSVRYSGMKIISNLIDMAALLLMAYKLLNQEVKHLMGVVDCSDF